MIPPEGALNQLAQRLAANGVEADPQKVASAILGLARLDGWTTEPHRVVEWLERLAVDVVNATGPRKGM